MANRPVVVSHTGVHGVCRSKRNLSDELMQRIAAKGGLICIGYWKGAVCDISPESIVKTLRYAIAWWAKTMLPWVRILTVRPQPLSTLPNWPF